MISKCKNILSQTIPIKGMHDWTDDGMLLLAWDRHCLSHGEFLVHDVELGDSF